MRGEEDWKRRREGSVGASAGEEYDTIQERDKERQPLKTIKDISGAFDSWMWDMRTKYFN